MENKIKRSMKAVITFLLAVCLTLAPTAVFFGESADAASGKWITTWATSLVNGSIELGSIIPGIAVQDIIPSKSTIRTQITVTAGGSKLRFKFSNQFGKAAITINEASVAKTDSSKKAAIVDGTQTPVTFGGDASITIAPGEEVWSDYVQFRTKALDEISISLFFRNLTYITSTGLSNGKTFLASGLTMISDKSSKVNYPSLPASNEINITSGTVTYHTIPFLSCVNTYCENDNARTAVFIGDSTLVNDTYLYFAKKLVSGGNTNIAVVNEAVIGNKLLSDGTGLIGNLCGKAMIDRFSRDVLSIAGVKYCFVKIGLNDIAHQFSKSLSASTPKFTPQELIAGYKTLVNICHKNGIKIYFFTKSPWKGYEREFLGQDGDLTWSPEIQALCDELTQWVKTNTIADGCIDCADLANPAEPYALCPSFTPDGAHLTDKGAIALADLIPVKFVEANEKTCKTAAAISGIDPYREKKQIIAEMKRKEQTTNAPSNTDPVTKPSNSTVNEPTTALPAAPSEVTEPVTEPVTSPDVTVPAYETPVTVPTKPAGSMSGNKYPQYNKNDVNYNVIDVDSIGTGGSSIGFILILTTAVIGSGIAVVLTMSKRKEDVI